MAVKHTLAAGVAALALLVTPVGLTAQWSEHGPAISNTPAVSTAYAAPNRPTTTTPPAPGGPTFTSSGTASKATGWQTRPGKGRFTDADCQNVAETVDQDLDNAADAGAAGDGRGAIYWMNLAETTASSAMDQGCAFSGLPLPL